MLCKLSKLNLINQMVWECTCTCSFYEWNFTCPHRNLYSDFCFYFAFISRQRQQLKNSRKSFVIYLYIKAFLISKDRACELHFKIQASSKRRTYFFLLCAGLHNTVSFPYTVTDAHIVCVCKMDMELMRRMRWYTHWLAILWVKIL